MNPEYFDKSDIVVGYNNQQPPGFRWTSSKCWGWNLIYTLKGKCEVSCFGKHICTAAPDNIMLFPPHIYRSYHVTETFSCYWGTFVTKLDINWKSGGAYHYCFPLNDPQSREWMLANFAEAYVLFDTRPHGWFMLAQLLLETVILRGNLSADLSEIPERLKTACNLLNDPTYHFVDVEKFAADCNLSRTTLYRLFETHIGTTPNDYREARILRNCCFLLENTSMSIKEIAEQGRFSDVYHFSKRFKKKYGIPPGEFRKNILNRDSEL